MKYTKFENNKFSEGNSDNLKIDHAYENENMILTIDDNGLVKDIKRRKIK